MTQCEADTLVQRLVDGFAGQRMESGNFRAYAERILEFDAAAGMRALEDLIERTDRFPSIAALRRAIKAQGGRLSGMDAAIATVASTSCDMCRGIGWHWIDWQTVTPCRCRWPRGAGPEPQPPVRREALPVEVMEAVTQFEHAVNAPASPQSLRLVLDTIRAVGAERAAAGVLAAAIMARG